MGSDLKPCPFCGGAAERIKIHETSAPFVRCVDCWGQCDSDGWSDRPGEGAATARAEAAEQRAEALAAEVARLRADALLILGRYRGIDDCFDGEDRLMLGDDECEALDALSEAAFFSTDDVAAAIGRVLAAAQPAGEVSDG